MSLSLFFTRFLLLHHTCTIQHNRAICFVIFLHNYLPSDKHLFDSRILTNNAVKVTVT